MSKIIVVGIDFSDCSINALEHAISIARNAKAGVRMVWVNHLDYSKEIFATEPDNVVAEATERFNELVKTYRYHLGDQKIDFVVRKGKVYREICNAAAEVKAFLIVIGTHGSSGFEEFWIGSNANRIVSSSKIPIITIRGGVDIHSDLKRIVVPLDSTICTREKLPMAALLAKYFHSEIHLLGLFTTQADDLRYRIKNYMSQAEEYLKENEIRYKIAYVEADNITDETLKYAESIKANLIAIMTEQEISITNLLLGPYALQMVNHSPIPVLSIHPEKP
jgi:nucleotide-binding universal stress UspA family protein